ncbi:hypothetical protein ACU685_29150, partial [Pseudomonas sp. LF195]
VEVFYAHTRPGGRPQESLRLKILVGEIQRTLPAPIIEKVIGSQLNPDDIEGYAKVFAPAGDTKRGDWVRMYWNGPLVRTNVPVQVAVDNSITEHHIDEFYVNNNLNETVAVFYTLTRGDELPRYSQVTEVLISRNLGELLAPTLLEAQITGPDTADLEPLRVEQGAQLVVRYVGMRDDDWIKPYMEGEGDGGSPDIPAKPGNRVLQEVVFDITRDAISANIRDRDATVVFTYAVTRGDDTKHSAKLTVTVKPIPVSALPQVIINRVPHNGLLDLNTITGNPLAAVLKWPFMATGQRVWITLKSSRHEPLPVLSNYPILSSELNGLTNKPVSRDWLQKIPPDDPISVEIKVTLDGSADVLRAVSFAPTTYKVKRVPTVDRTDFNTYSWNGWYNVNGAGALVEEGENIYWRSVKVEKYAASWLRKLYSGYNFMATNTIEISFDYRHESGANDLQIRGSILPGLGVRESPIFPTSATWRNIKFIMDIPSTAIGVSISFHIRGPVNTVSLDNIVVTML